MHFAVLELPWFFWVFFLYYDVPIKVLGFLINSSRWLLVRRRLHLLRQCLPTPRFSCVERVLSSTVAKTCLTGTISRPFGSRPVEIRRGARAHRPARGLSPLGRHPLIFLLLRQSFNHDKAPLRCLTTLCSFWERLARTHTLMHSHTNMHVSSLPPCGGCFGDRGGDGKSEFVELDHARCTPAWGCMIRPHRGQEERVACGRAEPSILYA